MFEWWNQFALWLTGLQFWMQFALVMIVLVPVCAVVAFAADRVAGWLGRIVHRRDS
ncbi:hypothetical protein [Sciscionella sediminilitoris]|uniref:hypothetical protein n=1 Tax=Sciscionella sediminilitoris TaxID=1445613 RepID=UPI0012E24A2E|nr:hypothetical protein [Sciscionella sp. SE31]